MNDKNMKRAFVLINNSEELTEIITLHDGTQTQLINQDDFSIKEIPVTEIKSGEWFVFAEKTTANDNEYCVCPNENGQFLWLCVKNNKDGSIEAKTTTSLTLDQKLAIVSKINKMIEEETN